jgi:hypothetical protein
MDAILDTLNEFIRSLPCDAIGTIAVLIGGGGLVLMGWRNLVGGIQGFFAAFGAILNALGIFLHSIILAFGATVGGLIILFLGGVAIYCFFITMGGG